MVAFITEIEQLPVRTDQPARVIIDERSGVIVMGDRVRIDTVAIAQGNLTIRVTETPQVSQPNAFSDSGDTVVVDRTQIDVDDGSGASTRAVLDRLEARHAWLEVIHHPENRGRGAALRTAYRAAGRRGMTHVVQLDADGQHAAIDVPRLDRKSVV